MAYNDTGIIGVKVVNDSGGGGVKSIQLDDVNWRELLGLQNDRLDIPNLVATVDWMFRATALISGAISAVPYTISPINGDPIHDSDKDDLYPPALERYAALDELIGKVAASYALMGRAYVLRQRNTRKADVGLRYLAPHTIKPEINAAGLVGFERQMSNGVRMRLPVEDVLYWWYPDPSIELGEPMAYPGAAAAKAAGVLGSMDTFLASYFQRGMIKATLFVTKEMVNQEERERIKSWWARVTGGLRNAWSTEVIAGDRAEIVQIGDGINELGNAALTQEKREAISTALGVPHSLVMSNAANYATAEQDVLNLYQNTAIPIMTDLARALNKQLFAPLGYWFRFETQRIEAVQKSELAKAEMVQRLVGGPVLTINEGRELLGYDPVPDGDTLAAPMSFGAMPAMLPRAEANADVPDADAEDGADIKSVELDRLGRFIANGTYLKRKFTSDILTPDEIEAAIIQHEWRDYP